MILKMEDYGSHMFRKFYPILYLYKIYMDSGIQSMYHHVKLSILMIHKSYLSLVPNSFLHASVSEGFLHRETKTNVKMSSKHSLWLQVPSSSQSQLRKSLLWAEQYKNIVPFCSSSHFVLPFFVMAYDVGAHFCKLSRVHCNFDKVFGGTQLCSVMIGEMLWS